ncbi:helix-turn-helix domain-containing protein [Gorillibacterium sp. sgz5001074]|uniref:helix-turn-helix domain-containing protein n=1 Tax=Gorillibacterium sp. sgz5001074 TaxID=3446695 RepID=UPI003F67D03E
MLSEIPTVTLPSIPPPYYLESGYVRYLPGDQHPSRRNLGVFDLIVVEQGMLHLGEEASRWEVGPGQVLLLLPDRYHYSVQPCTEETRFYWLHFQSGQGREAAISPLQPYSIRLPQYGTLPSPGQTCKRFSKLVSLAEVRRSEAFWQEQSLFLEFLRELDEAGSQREGSRALAVAEQTEAYIKLNYRIGLNNSRLSQDLHFHPNYLIRCMKEVYGMSPMEYLMQVRLEQAKLLLIKTDWSVTRISEEVGFEYAPYFTRCFTARNQVSPLQFRKQYTVPQSSIPRR